MPKLKAKTRRKRIRRERSQASGISVYRGRQTKTGNSLALRFDRALFHSHPEFNGEVEAHVISPGRMLVVAEGPTRAARSSGEDPVLSSFMSFLAADMRRSPESIAPLNAALVEQIGSLVAGVNASADEDLGDEALL